MPIDPVTLARQLADARAQKTIIPAPSGDPAFDLAAAYAVEAELARRRRDEADGGHRRVGLKVGFANKAVWRALKLETLVWGTIYDDTVREAAGGAATLSIDRMTAPKIEPEVVFRMAAPLDAAVTEPAAVLEAVEWMAIGFEIIDCPFPDWKFQPQDFVASYGLHAALIVGEPLRVRAGDIAALVEQLPRFTVKLSKDGETVAEGSGKNSLRSPALCLAELAAATARQPGTAPLAAGDLVSSGTLTESQRIAPGQTWRVDVDGLDLQALTVTVL